MNQLPIKVLCLFLACLISLLAKGQKVIPLYEGKPNGSENWDWQEQISTENAFNIELTYNVVEPTITAYLPPYYLAK